MKTKLKKLYDFSNTWTGTIIIVLLVIFFIAQAFVIPSGSMRGTLLIGDHLFVKKFSYGIPIPHLPWLEIPLLPDLKGNGHLIDGKGPDREDIVVFRNPNNIKEHYVKRCVAIEGDEIIYTKKAFFLRPHEGDDYIKKTFTKKQIKTIGGKLWIKNPFINKYKGIHYDMKANLFEQMTLYLMANRLAMKPALIEELPSENIELNFNAFYFKVPKNEYFMLGDNRDHSNDSRFWGSVPYKLIEGKPWFVYFSWNSGIEVANDKQKYRIRWNRIGRFISTLQNEQEFIENASK